MEKLDELYRLLERYSLFRKSHFAGLIHNNIAHIVLPQQETVSFHPIIRKLDNI